ncbi:transcriptional regulator [Veronia nyctiphanis]|uniref:Transcriptional regulator n=1 Tax=Veronia nyctiphanis TaxID=1278244 RepID=A0A4Q0YMS0_9GAMM|nr:helix-turn-helix transcriptional regulator [Veronia nyctiphanis]RXJ72019.1 transcriptional regulator [Veronia nyctiphanis]RXJ72066.1 transcriptional regulator [Veronia nyctiphanis]
MPVRENTAQLLRVVRLETGLSQEKLAKLSGVDRTFISGVERNRRNITLDTLEKLLTALGAETGGFLSRLSEMETQSSASTKSRAC